MFRWRGDGLVSILPIIIITTTTAIIVVVVVIVIIELPIRRRMNRENPQAELFIHLLNWSKHQNT